jgi:hypothetical protein
MDTAMHSTRSSDPAISRHRFAADERGFSLVELMTSSLVTLVVLALAVSTFSEAKNATELSENVVETQQNLRAGLNFMVRDIVQTGAEIPTGGVPIPSGGGTIPVTRPGPGGLTFDINADTVLHAITPGPSLGPAVNGVPTDIVSVLYVDPTIDFNSVPLKALDSQGRRAEVWLPNEARPPGSPTGGTDISGASNGIQVGDLIMLDNGLGTALQSVTGVNGQEIRFDPNDIFNLNQGGQPGSISAIASDFANSVFPPTTIKRLRLVTFFLEVPPGNPNAPWLMRQDGLAQARPIALVVDNLQMTYDLVDGVANPTNQDTPILPNTPAQIRKVNLFLAARSEAPSMVHRRTFRTNLSTQISLRSLAYVDRYQ